MNFNIAFENVFILALLAVPGFIAVKAKVLTDEGSSRTLSKVLLFICQPFVTIDAFLNTPYQPSVVLNLLYVLLFTLLHMGILLLIAKFVFSKQKESNKYAAYNFACIFGNLGYMCIPFLQVLTNFDSEVILYATSSMVAFNIMAWTYGCFLFTKDKKDVSIKRAIINPPTVTFLLLLPLFLLNINFITFSALSPLQNVSRMFAVLTAPLSMTILGIKFASMKFKELFNDYNIIKVIGVRNFLSPVLGFGLVALFSLFLNLQGVRLNLIVLAAMPVATNVMMFSEMNNGERKTPAKLVMVSTILSIITIPIALMLFY